MLGKIEPKKVIQKLPKRKADSTIFKAKISLKDPELRGNGIPLDITIYVNKVPVITTSLFGQSVGNYD